MKRLHSEGLVVPRNVLPLWGRGTAFFDTFFWDGKVEKSADGVFSQFFEFKPSDNALILASLLPIVEIREMVVDDYEVNTKFKENVEIALKFYKEILKIQKEQMMVDLGKYYELEELTAPQHVGSAIRAHQAGV